MEQAKRLAARTAIDEYVKTGMSVGVAWQDTMTTVISYDLGHLVVSNGDHYVSYGSN